MFPRFMAHFLWVCFSIYALCLKVELIDTVQTGNLENVRLLVEQGADLDQVDSSGWSPLFWASYGGQLEIAQYLVEQGSTMDKATNYGAASNGHLEVVRYLLEQGADKEKANQLGWTPLHRAAYMGRLEVAKLLMHYGADVNAKTTLVNCRSTSHGPTGNGGRTGIQTTTSQYGNTNRKGVQDCCVRWMMFFRSARNESIKLRVWWL